MRSLSSIAWRNSASRRLRSLLSVVGIALGVALLLAALAVDRGIDEAIDSLSSDLIGRASLRLTAFEPSGMSMGTVTAVRGVEGVAAVAPVVEHTAFVGTGERPNLGVVQVVGIDPRAETMVHDYRLLAGVFPGADTGLDVLFPAEWTRARGLSVGDSVTIPGAGGQLTFRVAGLLEAAGPARMNAGRVAFIGLETAQRLFAMEGRVTRADIQIAEGADVATVEKAVEGAIVGEHYVLTRASEVAASQRGQVADFRVTTALLAALALFVGGFLIYNTLSASVRERIREIGLLRAAGATRRQVYRLVFWEGLLLGSVGSAVGVALGIVAAEAMAVYVRATAAAPLDRPSILPSAVLLVFAAGLLVTLAATVRPAARAAGVSPVDALRSRAERRTRLDPRRVWIVALNAGLAIVWVGVWPLVAESAPSETLVRAYLVIVAFVVAVVVAPWFFPLLGRVAAVPFTKLLPAEGRMARGALLRDRGRSAVTMGALMVGLAAVVAIAMFAYNVRRAGDAWLESTLPGEVVVRALAPTPLDFGDDFRAVPGVASVSPMRAFDVDIGGRSVDAAAIEPEAFEAAGALDFVAGERSTAFAAVAAGGAVLVPRPEAERLGLGLGSTIRVRTSAGEHPFAVAGIVARSFPGTTSETLLFGWKDGRDVFGYLDATLFVVRAAPGTTPSGLASGLRAVAEPLAFQVYTVAEIARTIAGQLGRLFGFFDALALVALVVATLGIANTLTMSVQERVREFGILRASGMSRSGVRRMVLVEGWLIGLVGGLLGVVGGVGLGWMLLGFARTAAFQPPLDIPWTVLVWSMLLALMASVLAAYYPARVAGNIPIASAVRQH